MKSLRRVCLTAVLTILSHAAFSQTPPSVPKAGYEVEGRPGFVIHYDLASVAWEAFEAQGMPVGLMRQLLSRSPSMGAVSQITYVPAGWSRPLGYHVVANVLTVLAGVLTIGAVAGA